MNTKAKKRRKKKSSRLARPKLLATRSTRASGDAVAAGPDTIRDAIAGGFQTADMGDILLYQANR